MSSLKDIEIRLAFSHSEARAIVEGKQEVAPKTVTMSSGKSWRELKEAIISTDAPNYETKFVMVARYGEVIRNMEILPSANDRTLAECSMGKGTVIAVLHSQRSHDIADNDAALDTELENRGELLSKLKGLIEGQSKPKAVTEIETKFTHLKSKELIELEIQLHAQKRQTRQIIDLKGKIEDLKREVRLPGLQSITTEVNAACAPPDTRWLNTPYEFPAMIGPRCIVMPDEGMWYETVDGALSKLVMGPLSECPSPTVHQIAHSLQATTGASKIAVVDAQSTNLFRGRSTYLASDVVRMGKDNGIVVVIDMDSIAGLSQMPMAWGSEHDAHVDFSIVDRVAGFADSVANLSNSNYRVLPSTGEDKLLSKSIPNRQDSTTPPPERVNEEMKSSFCIIVCVTSRYKIRDSMARRFKFPLNLTEASLATESKVRRSDIEGPRPTLVPYTVSHVPLPMPTLICPNEMRPVNPLARQPVSSVWLQTNLSLRSSAVGDTVKTNRVILPNAAVKYNESAITNYQCVIEFQVSAAVKTFDVPRDAKRRFLVGFASTDSDSYVAYDPLHLKCYSHGPQNNTLITEIKSHALFVVRTIDKVQWTTSQTRLAVAFGMDRNSICHSQLFYSDSQGVMQRRGPKMDFRTARPTATFCPFVQFENDDDKIIIERVSMDADCNPIYFPQMPTKTTTDTSDNSLPSDSCFTL